MFVAGTDGLNVGAPRDNGNSFLNLSFSNFQETGDFGYGVVPEAASLAVLASGVPTMRRRRR